MSPGVAAPSPWIRVLLAGLVFGLLYRLPAAWFGSLLPEGVRCGELSGSVWRGQCSGLEADIPGRPAGAPAVSIGQVRWAWQPQSVLRGELRVRVQLQQRGTNASAQMALGPSGALQVSALRWQGPLDATLLPFLPPGLAGRLDTDDLELGLKSGQLSALRGTLRVSDLARTSPSALRLGSYRLEFGPPQTPLLSGETAVAQAAVASVAPGPLEAQGDIKLSSRGWEAQARLRATPQAQPALRAMLPALGAADAAGQRQIMLSGSF
jgi:Type II secretion system (T2SS), protein N